MSTARTPGSIALSRNAITCALWLMTVSVTFTTPGTYHYADPYFPSVTGIVVVQ